MPRRTSRIKDPANNSLNRAKDLSEDSFEHFARKNFQGKVPPRFSRKEIPHPVLRYTPAADKEAARKIFKILLRFMGDVTDYRHNMTKSSQPNMGSIMTRLKKEMGIDTTAQVRGTRPLVGDDDDDLPMTGLPNKPRMGTMSKLTATLAARFFRARSRATVWQMLPLEETLRGSLDQIHFIIGYGLLRPTLRDEIYCQICKQLVDNPFTLSLPRGWFMLQMVAGCFPPSDRIAKYIIKFVDDGPPMYASNVRKLLRRIIASGERCQPPAHIEIEAALHGKPLDVSVTLMDGKTQIVAVDAASTSREVCEKICRAISLKDRFGFGIYVSMQNKIASLGNGRDHVMNSISQCEQIYRDQDEDEASAPWQLFFRKEIFTPWENTVKDPVATNLIYAQVVRGIMMGEYACESENDLALLVARQCYIEHGANVNVVELRSLVPAYLPASERDDEDALDRWLEIVQAAYKRLFRRDDTTPPSSYRVCLDIVKYAKIRWPLAFSRYFDVAKLDGPAWDDEMFSLAINSSGVYVVGESKQMLHKMAFHEIAQVLGDSGQNSVFRHVITFEHLNGAMLTFETVDSDDIRQLVHFMTQGILQRSTFALATQNYRGRDSSEIDLEDGDLLKLSVAAGAGAFRAELCVATNQSTGHTGQVNSGHLHILATLTAPSSDYLRLLRASSRHRITNTAPFSEYRSDTLYSSRSGDSRNSMSSGHFENGRERRLTSRSSSGSGRPWSSRSWSRENSFPADGTE